jgi:hypothetical protein
MVGMKPFAEDVERFWFLVGKFGRARGFGCWATFEWDWVEVGVEEGNLGAELAFGEFEVDFAGADEDADFFGKQALDSGVR